MFKKFFSGKADAVRKLDTPNDLEVGDIISLKYRQSLPPELRESEFQVSKVGTYEYASSKSKEIVLKNESNQIIFMSMEDNDGELSLCFAKKISRKHVTTLFDEHKFSQLWSDNWVELQVNEQPEQLEGWLAECYSQTIKEQQAYYYARDALTEDLNHAEDGEELRFHECEGDDDSFALNIETSEDGSTDVFLQVYCPVDVIAEMFPHGN